MGASPVTWIGQLERDDAPREPAVPEAVLVQYPVVLGMRYRQHLAEVFRELQIVASSGNGAGPDEESTPARARLVALARDVTAQFGDLLAGPHPDTERAVAEGVSHVDLRYPLDGRSRFLATHFAVVMEEVDGLTRAEALVTLPATGVLYALRRWSVEEYVRQFDGLPPRPWPAWWAEHRDAYAEGGADADAVDGDPDGPAASAGAPS